MHSTAMSPSLSLSLSLSSLCIIIMHRIFTFKCTRKLPKSVTSAASLMHGTLSVMELT